MNRHRTFIDRPGLVERGTVIFLLFIGLFGTPARWFSDFVGANSGPASDPLLTIGSLAGVTVLLFYCVGYGQAVYRAVTADVVALLFVGVLVVSPFWSDYRAESLSSSINFLVVYLIAVAIAVRFTFREFIGLAAIAVGMGLALSLFWVLAMGPLGRSAGGWDGLGTQKNALGSHGVWGMLVSAFAMRVFPERRFLLGSLVVVSVVLTVGSESKTALAAGLLSLVSMVVYVAFRSRKTLFGAVVITLTATSVAALAFATANIGLIAGWLDKDVTLTGRTDFWPILIRAVGERPILGYGIDGYFRGPLSSAFDIVIGGTFQPTHAHNALLQVGLNAGLLGMVLFLATHARMVGRSVEHARVVPKAEGLFPLVVLTLAVMLSITESGLLGQRFGATVFFIALIRSRAGVEDQQRLRKVSGAAASAEDSDSSNVSPESPQVHPA